MVVARQQLSRKAKKKTTYPEPKLEEEEEEEDSEEEKEAEEEDSEEERGTTNTKKSKRTAKSTTSTTTTTTTTTSKSDLELGRTALFSAVEEDCLIKSSDNDNDSDNNGENDNNSMMMKYSPTPFVRLFVSSSNNTSNTTSTYLLFETSDSIINNIREQRYLLYSTIENLSKSHARRFFSSLSNIVTDIIASESYIPESILLSNREEENEVDHNENDDTDHVVVTPDPKSTECLQFLQYAAVLVRTYVDGQAEIVKSKMANKNDEKEGNTTSRRSSIHNNQKQLPIIEEVFVVAQQLHDIVFVLTSMCGSSLSQAMETQSAIITMCEKWWLHNAINREHVIQQVLPILTYAAIGRGGGSGNSDSNNNNNKEIDTELKINVVRLFKIRDALTQIDFHDPSSSAMKHMLLRLVSSPLCLKQVEGRRLLAYLLIQIDDDYDYYENPTQTQEEQESTSNNLFCKDLHRAICVQIPHAKKPILEAYGEIYLRAWKESSASTEGVDESSRLNRKQMMIENEILSDLVYRVLHVSQPKTVKALMTIMEPFHTAATIKTSSSALDVAALLSRLYGPVLWRSLSSANAAVRIQSSRILTHVFPLTSNGSNNSGNGNNKNINRKNDVLRGCKALNTLLTDQQPRVRIAGSDAVATILGNFWDVLPPTEIRTFLNHIVAEHASDATNAHVRASALNTVSYLLENVPQAHGVLRPLLPPLGNLIHDKVEKVRCAVVRMLLRIKKMKGIKYYHVVPVAHLTGRLADDGLNKNNIKCPVASTLTCLLANSIFPTSGKNVTATIQIERTLTFLQSDPLAASVFYANLANHIPTDAVAKLIVMLLRCIQGAVEKEQQQQSKRRSHKQRGRTKRRRVDQNDDDDEGEEDDSDDNDEEEEELLSANDTSLMAKVTETICTLWQSIEDKLQLPENEDSNTYLIESFSGRSLMDILLYYESLAAAEQNNNNDNSREDCYRTCAAILRLSGRLPSKAVEGLVAHVTEILGSLPADDNKNNDHGIGTLKTDNKVPAHVVALLCLWDLTEEVATSLATSIESVFETDHTLHFGSPDSTTGKRRTRQSRSSRNSKSSSRGGGGKTAAVIVIPEMPPLAALNILGGILSGSDPSSVSARQYILGSENASNKIEKALERGTKYAESILIPGVNNVYSKNILESEVSYILQVCEAYGRFALHREALSNACVTFSDQARRLLDWTTGVVLPALLEKRPAVPFNDLNLSRISVERSFDFPVSPVPTGPPKRRSKRDKTPVKMQGNSNRSSSLFESPCNTNTPSSLLSSSSQDSVVFAKAFAVSMMQSCALLFAEWLAVGGAGAEEISASAIKWITIFNNKTTRSSSAEEEDEEGTAGDNYNEAYQELIPAFSRLALQLCKMGENFSLLNKLIFTIPESDDEEGGTVIKTISVLLSTRGNSSTVVSKTVRCVLDAAHEHIDAKQFTITSDTTQSFRSLCPSECGCIVPALMSLMSSKQACVELAKVLVECFQHNDHASLSDSAAMFNAHILSMLWDLPESSTLFGTIIRRLDITALDPESAIVPVLQELDIAAVQ